MEEEHLVLDSPTLLALRENKQVSSTTRTPTSS
jgi:hypothetical protein